MSCLGLLINTDRGNITTCKCKYEAVSYSHIENVKQEVDELLDTLD
jgi:hypothetical protein